MIGTHYAWDQRTSRHTGTVRAHGTWGWALGRGTGMMMVTGTGFYAVAYCELLRDSSTVTACDENMVTQVAVSKEL